MLHQEELKSIQQVAESHVWKKGYCAENVANILGLLPYSIVNKLKVVLSSHELEPLRYYGEEDYRFHVFLLGNTDNGLKIIDVASTRGINNDARNWLNDVFCKEELNRCFFNDRFLRWLPQFRFIEGNTYQLFCEKEIRIDSSLLTPNLIVKHQDISCFNYQLWNDSFFLNMYETWQLFTGEKTYEDSVTAHLDGATSPKDRLSHYAIRELREALELF